MRVVRAAAVQLSPVLYSRDATVDAADRAIDGPQARAVALAPDHALVIGGRDLGQQGVQFATFPETVPPGRRESSWSLRASS